MKEAMDKLLQFQACLKGQSASSTLVDIASFINHDLQTVIDHLGDAQNFMDDLERENIELRRELNAERLKGRMTA